MMVASITANDRGHADAALVRRFRQAQTKRERTGVFADAVRQHREALLCFCAERLWPDADAAVAAAADVLIAARLAMADPVKLPRPDRLRGWLLGVAAQDCRTPGQPARIEDIDWDAVRARAVADVPEMPDSPASMASLRRWLEQIVGTLPEPRQRMYDLFVTRGLDSLNAALELGTTVAEVRRVRRENRQAILRAFEVMALAAAEAVRSSMGTAAPSCAELGQILSDAQRAGVPQEGGRRFMPVLPASFRLSVSRHLSECVTCQDRRDDCMARWAPELLPILAAAELFEQVMADSQAIPERRPPGVAGARKRVSSARTARTVVVRRTVAAGGGVLVALTLLAFVWPGLLRGTPSDAASSPQAFNSGAPVGVGVPQVAGTGQVPSSSQVGPVRSKAPGQPGSVSPTSAAPSFGSVPTSVYFTVPPSTTPTSSPVPVTSGSSTASKSAAPSASASSPKSTKTSTPSPTKSTPKPTASTSAPAPSSTPSSTPTTSASTPAPSATPSASASTTAPTTSASAPPPSATPTDSASVTAPADSSSAPAPSASATS
jgi:DNA-directed RNA polymerase specialized sigma24 family protein